MSKGKMILDKCNKMHINYSSFKILIRVLKISVNSTVVALIHNASCNSVYQIRRRCYVDEKVSEGLGGLIGYMAGNKGAACPNHEDLFTWGSTCFH